MAKTQQLVILTSLNKKLVSYQGSCQTNLSDQNKLTSYLTNIWYQLNDLMRASQARTSRPYSSVG